MSGIMQIYGPSVSFLVLDCYIMVEKHCMRVCGKYGPVVFSRLSRFVPIEFCGMEILLQH